MSTASARTAAGGAHKHWQPRRATHAAWPCIPCAIPRAIPCAIPHLVDGPPAVARAGACCEASARPSTRLRASPPARCHLPPATYCAPTRHLQLSPARWSVRTLLHAPICAYTYLHANLLHPWAWGMQNLLHPWVCRMHLHASHTRIAPTQTLHASYTHLHAPTRSYMHLHAPTCTYTHLHALRHAPTRTYTH
jgi:hypothetical protein